MSGIDEGGEGGHDGRLSKGEGGSSGKKEQATQLPTFNHIKQDTTIIQRGSKKCLLVLNFSM